MKIYYLCALLIAAETSNSLKSSPSLFRKKISLTRKRGIEDDNDLQDDVLGAPVGPLPSVSSRINYDKMEMKPTVDLWIVGAGTLGMQAAQQWRALYPDSVVVAETASVAKHEELKRWSTPKLRSERDGNLAYCARNVLVCIPPSASQDYEEELASSFRLWSGPSLGNLVFTSSTVVYGDSFGNTVNEKFRLDSRNSRSYKMICAEEAILGRGGSVVRLGMIASTLSCSVTHSFDTRSRSVLGDSRAAYILAQGHRGWCAEGG